MFLRERIVGHKRFKLIIVFPKKKLVINTGVSIYRNTGGKPILTKWRFYVFT